MSNAMQDDDVASVGSTGAETVNTTAATLRGPSASSRSLAERRAEMRRQASAIEERVFAEAPPDDDAVLRAAELLVQEREAAAQRAAQVHDETLRAAAREAWQQTPTPRGVEESKAPPSSDGDAFRTMRRPHAGAGAADSDDDDVDAGGDGDGDGPAPERPSYTIAVADNLDPNAIPWEPVTLGMPGLRDSNFTATANEDVARVLEPDIAAHTARKAATDASAEAIVSDVADILGNWGLNDTDGQEDVAAARRAVADGMAMARSQHVVAAAVDAQLGVESTEFVEPGPQPGYRDAMMPPNVFFALRRMSLQSYLSGRGAASPLPAGVTLDTVLDKHFANFLVEMLEAKGATRPDWMSTRYFALQWRVVGVTAVSCLVVMTNGVQLVVLPVQDVVAVVFAAEDSGGSVDGGALAAKAAPLAWTMPPFHRATHAAMVVHGEQLTVRTPDASVYSVDIRAATLPVGTPFVDPYKSPFAAYCPGLTVAVHVMPSVDYLKPPEPVVAVLTPPSAAGAGAGVAGAASAGPSGTTVFYVWVPTPVGAMAAEAAQKLADAHDTMSTVTAEARQEVLFKAIAREAPAGMFVPRNDAPLGAVTPRTAFDWKVGGFALPEVDPTLAPNTRQGVVAPTWSRPPQTCVPIQPFVIVKEDDTKAFKAAVLGQKPNFDTACNLTITAESAEIILPPLFAGQASTAVKTVVVALHNNTVFLATPSTRTVTWVPLPDALAQDTVQRVAFVKEVLLTSATEKLTMSVPGTLRDSLEVQPPRPSDLVPPEWFMHMVAGTDPPRTTPPRHAAKVRPLPSAARAKGAGDDDDRVDPAPDGDDDACEDEDASGTGTRKRGVTFADPPSGSGGDERLEGRDARRREETFTQADLDEVVARAAWGVIHGARVTRSAPARDLLVTACKPGTVQRVLSGVAMGANEVCGISTMHVAAPTPTGQQKTYIVAAVAIPDAVRILMVCAGVEAHFTVRLKGACATTWQQDGSKVLLHVRSIQHQISTLAVEPAFEADGRLAIRIRNLGLLVSVQTEPIATQQEADTICTFGNGNLAAWSRMKGIATFVVRPSAAATTPAS